MIFNKMQESHYFLQCKFSLESYILAKKIHCLYINLKSVLEIPLSNI